jgi:hypothetical protein
MGLKTQDIQRAHVISPFSRDDMLTIKAFLWAPLRLRVEMNLYFFLRPTNPSMARPEQKSNAGSGSGTTVALNAPAAVMAG